MVFGATAHRIAQEAFTAGKNVLVLWIWTYYGE
jgi:hypothetical protein